ncbi:MAG: DUF3152 domain-containing protein [Egibacteraceae bacterium]
MDQSPERTPPLHRRTRRIVGLLGVSALLVLGAVGWQSVGGSEPSAPRTAVLQAVRTPAPAGGDGGPAPSASPQQKSRSQTSVRPTAKSKPPVEKAKPRPTAPPARPSGEFEVAEGMSEVVGDASVLRFTVEAERGSRVRPAGFARAVERALFDSRSWTAVDDIGLQRVDGGDVDFRVTLAHPDTVDELCAPLQTIGYYSCFKGERSIINLDRWQEAVPAFGDRLTKYRLYVINHEVGHALGHGHQECPEQDMPAPVMMQQTKGVRPCVPNAWPAP